MRNYIPKNKFIRPEVWKRVTSVIRDIDALENERERIINEDNLKHVGAHLKEIERKLKAYNKVWETSSDETKRLLIHKIKKNKTYRDITLPLSESTMKRMVAKFVHQLGKELGEL